MNRNTVRHQQEQYEKYTGLPHYTRHSLRHYAATAVVAQNPRSAQKLLGHKNIATTMRYDHTSLEQVRKDVAAATPLHSVVQARKRSKRLI